MISDHPLEMLVGHLARRAKLSDEDRRAVLALPHASRHINANTYLVREGEAPRSYCTLVLSGLAFRHKLTETGKRQIVSLHLAGELLDLQHLFLNIADHSVQALTDLHVADIDRSALQHIALARPEVGRALWVDALVDSSIYREWVLNVGRRDARARIAHLLCEMAIRMRAAGALRSERFQLPMTQEQLGDATGLTSVHVNRTIKALVEDRLIQQSGRSIAILDWDGVCSAGDFNPLYLHLDQVGPQFDGPLSSVLSESGATH